MNSDSLIQKIKTFFIDHFNLLFHSAAENHLRIQYLEGKVRFPVVESSVVPALPLNEGAKWPEEAEGVEKEAEPPVEAKPPTPTPTPVTNLEFNSFTHLKRYQKRLRIATLSTSSTIIAIIAVAISLQFMGSHSKGATFGWVQTDWSTLSSNLASHLTDRTGWTSYSAKDDSIDTSNGELKLATVSGSVTETDDDSGFDDGSHNGTSSSGTGVTITGILGEDRIDNFEYNGTTGADGSVQEWTVPVGVTSITIDALGAAGGNGGGGVAGVAGGLIAGTLAASPGDTYYILIGGKGVSGINNIGGAGGYGGGGKGGDGNGGGGGGGGGATWISSTSIFEQGTVIVVAAGGGGSGTQAIGTAGGTGGGLNGGNAGNTACTNGNTGAGQGGTQSAGGVAGTANSCSGHAGNNGNAGIGGDGGTTGGGGGGGGYFGGGGGSYLGGGGGGSGYIKNTLADASTTAGAGSTGNGSLSVSYTTPTAYNSPGTFISQITDTGHKNASWGNLEWTTTQTANTQVVFKARTSNNSDMSGATDFSSCDPIATVNSANATSSAAMAGNNCVNAGDRYIQYQATLSTSNPLETPEIQDVKISYDYYSPSPSSNIAKTSDADFSTNTNSNVGISGSGDDALLALLKPSHAVCASDFDCGSGNCDTDFASATKYCHTTASSCADSSGEPWEQVDGYEKCSGNDYYKSCANSIWGEQQNNPNLTNSYCDAGGGEQSGYQSAATCTSGTEGGFDSPACNSCSPYIAETTSSCKTSCSLNSDCYDGYHCSSNSCVSNWISGFCGLQIYYISLGTQQWKTSNSACNTPQCGQDGAQNGDDLVTDNSIDFAEYPGRNMCKNLGGRLPTRAELLCIYENKGSLALSVPIGAMSSAEYSMTDYWARSFMTGGEYQSPKTSCDPAYGNQVICVK